MKKNLRSACIIMLLAVTFTSLKAQVNLTALNTSYTQDFNTLAATGTANDTISIPAGWAFLETGTNANRTYAAGTGSSNTGNTYSLGTDADRAFGGLQSGSLVPIVGAKFVNNTGATITSLHISYWGEQWRLGATPRTQGDRLDFQYSLNASSLSTGTWIDNDSLDFISPVLSGTVGALNGNANHRSRTNIVTDLSIPAGATFWIRWTDFNVASSDDALGVDDFSITPAGVPSNQPSITVSPSALNFGQVTVNTSKVLAYAVSVSNLTDSLVHINTFTPDFSLSLDQIDYDDSVILTHNDTVFVKFSPHANGSYLDSALHYSSGISKSVRLAGSGYDPLSNIIPISEARGKSTGAKVTVTGRVTVANEQGSPSFVQDATGGISVFDFTFSNAVAIGDSVIVTGTIDFFNNQVEIQNVSFSLADSVKRFIAPKLISINDLAANEGLLVTVQQVSLVNKAFVFYPQSTEQITNGTTQADLRIDGDTNIPGLTKPQSTVDITGVVGRFKTDPQLLPRFRADIPGVAEPQTPFDSIPRTETFDLMNWNLEFFGAIDREFPTAFGPPDETLQMENVRQIIDSVHADVIAVQEVSNDSIFNEMMRELPDYKAVCSDRYSFSFNGFDPTFPPQKVCVIYDSATVEILSTRAMFENLYDSARLFDASLLPNYPTGDASSFWSSGRLPFMVTANVTINGVTEKIRFIDIHGKSGDQQSDYDRRVYDETVLKDSLDAHYPSDKIVILGDYNDDLRQSIVTGLPTSYLNFVQDTSRYNPITRVLSFAGAKSTISFDGVIDNQIITNELNEEHLAGSEKVITPFLEIPNYGTTTSDHLPVISRFKFISPVPPTPILTFVDSAVSREEGSGTYVVRLKLSSTLPDDQTVVIKVQEGRGVLYGSILDYITSPVPVHGKITRTIPAGKNEIEFTVTPNRDLFRENDETITFSILSVSGGIKPGAQADFIFTITDVPVCLPVFAVFPNPTFGTVNIYTLPENEDTIISGSLIDSQGHVLSTGNGTAAHLSSQFTNVLEGKRLGVYIVRLTACEKVITIRVLKL